MLRKFASRVFPISSLRYLERILWTVGLSLLAFCLVSASGMVAARRSAAHIEPQPVTNRESEGIAPAAMLSQKDIAQTSSPVVVGRVEIPAIDMVTPLFDGDDSMSLTQGAGHIPGTAYPGGLGTVGIAGHRDTHFRLLSKVAAGMDVRLIDRTGTYHYRTTSSEIVTPEQVSVLDIVSEPGLVLITCYPFSYIGHAPKRFVVHAALVSAAPDEPSGH